MKLGKFSFKLKREFERVDVLHWGHFFFLLLATLTEFLNEGLRLSMAFKVIFIFGYYYLFNRVKKDLRYSFWAFAIILIVYFLGKTIQSVGDTGLFIFYFASAFILGVEMFILHTPLYYPIVSWWEYDFRYRNDLKIKIKWGRKNCDGQLIDMRRKAACVVAFEKIDLGTGLTLVYSDEKGNFKLKCEIMSCRQYSLGRPYQYGVRFLFENDKDQHSFTKFGKFWRSRRRKKISKKFTHQTTSKNP